MSLKLSKNTLYQVLFALCVAVTYINIYELTFGIWCFAALLTIRKSYSLTLFHYILCFAGILLIAFIAAFYNNHTTYNYLRDFSYLIKPIIGLVLGYQLCRSHSINPIKTIVYTGLVISVAHLCVLFYSILAYRIINMHELRQYGGYFSDFEFYALILLIFNKEFDYNLSPNKRWMLIAVVGLSSFLYLARTNFLQFIILFLTLKGYFEINRRSLIVLGTLAVVTLSGYAVIYNMSLSRNGTGMEAFLFKVKNAPIEAFKTKINEEDYRDFNDNYRSFENIITVKQVSYDGTWAILFGKGLGATVDAGREIFTNDGTLVRYIPVLHNGFITVFLKSGVVGLALSIWFIVLLYKQRKSYSNLNRHIGLLLTGTAIYLVLANWVLLGLYLKLDNKAILIGFLLAYRHILFRQDKPVDRNLISA
jgi:hypothetical protein